VTPKTSASRSAASRQRSAKLAARLSARSAAATGRGTSFGGAGSGGVRGSAATPKTSASRSAASRQRSAKLAARLSARSAAATGRGTSFGGAGSGGVRGSAAPTPTPDMTLGEVVAAEQKRIEVEYGYTSPNQAQQQENIARQIIESRDVADGERYGDYTGPTAQAALERLKSGEVEAARRLGDGVGSGVAASSTGANIEGRHRDYVQASARIDPRTGRAVEFGGGMAGSLKPEDAVRVGFENLTKKRDNIRKGYNVVDFSGLKGAVGKIPVSELGAARQGVEINVEKDYVEGSFQVAEDLEGKNINYSWVESERVPVPVDDAPPIVPVVEGERSSWDDVAKMGFVGWEFRQPKAPVVDVPDGMRVLSPDETPKIYKPGTVVLKDTTQEVVKEKWEPFGYKGDVGAGAFIAGSTLFGALEGQGKLLSARFAGSSLYGAAKGFGGALVTVGIVDKVVKPYVIDPALDAYYDTAPKVMGAIDKIPMEVPGQPQIVSDVQERVRDAAKFSLYGPAGPASAGLLPVYLQGDLVRGGILKLKGFDDKTISEVNKRFRSMDVSAAEKYKDPAKDLARYAAYAKTGQLVFGGIASAEAKVGELAPKLKDIKLPRVMASKSVVTKGGGVGVTAKAPRAFSGTKYLDAQGKVLKIEGSTGKGVRLGDVKVSPAQQVTSTVKKTAFNIKKKLPRLGSKGYAYANVEVPKTKLASGYKAVSKLAGANLVKTKDAMILVPVAASKMRHKSGKKDKLVSAYAPASILEGSQGAGAANVEKAINQLKYETLQANRNVFQETSEDAYATKSIDRNVNQNINQNVYENVYQNQFVNPPKVVNQNMPKTIVPGVPIPGGMPFGSGGGRGRRYGRRFFRVKNPVKTPKEILAMAKPKDPLKELKKKKGGFRL
jgi:hypothetical protein